MKCENCRNREYKPMSFYDYCPVIDESISPDDDAYSLCCDCWVEDI